MPTDHDLLPFLHDHRPVRGSPQPVPHVKAPPPKIHPRSGVGPWVPASPRGSRLVVVKAGMIAGSAKSSLGSKTGRHLAYLQRDGTGQDGTKAVLLTADEQPVDAKTFQQRAAGDRHQYHLIISPANGDRLDMPRYVQDVMAQVQRDLHRRLDYVSSVHVNTAWTHAHVVLRGTTLDGELLIINSRYLHEGVRYRAQAIATDYLGRLSPQEARAAERRLSEHQDFVAAHGRQRAPEPPARQVTPAVAHSRERSADRGLTW